VVGRPDYSEPYPDEAALAVLEEIVNPAKLITALMK
jgi:hypothetical protein